MSRRLCALGIIENAVVEGIADIETQAGPGLGVVLADMMTEGKKAGMSTHKGMSTHTHACCRRRSTCEA